MYQLMFLLEEFGQQNDFYVISINLEFRPLSTVHRHQLSPLKK
jgi:hypothetical protein